MQSTDKIYAMIDPRSSRIRYVGRTSKTLCWRLGKHLESAGTYPENEKCAWVLELFSLGLAPRMLLLDECSDDIAGNVEELWISQFDDLLNKDVRPSMVRPYSGIGRKIAEYIANTFNAEGRVPGPSEIAREAGVSKGYAHQVRTEWIEENSQAL